MSFYGGPSGKDFTISWIFSARYGAGNTMQNDIGMGWKSPIAVGSYTVISYGQPGTSDYEYYLSQDLNDEANQGLSFNSTLWQKVYDENKTTDNGIGYKLIMSMAGHTPRIQFITPIDVLDADQPPNIIYNNENPDAPTIKLQLPRQQVLSVIKPALILNADQEPDIEYNDDDINNPTLTFKLPKSQILSMNPLETLKANQEPEVVFDNSDINNPKITFKLPKSQVISMEEPVTVLNADQDPNVVLDSTDIDKPKLIFSIPKSQIIDLAETEVLNANELPSTELNIDDINNPVIKFKLPQSQQIQLGTVTWIKANEQPKITLDIDDINHPKLNFQLPISQTIQPGTTTVLNADEKPSFQIDSTDPDNPVFNLRLPQSQVMQDPTTIVMAPLNDPSVTLNKTDINRPQLQFQLPRAIRFYYGNLLGERTGGPFTITSDAFVDYGVGDYYINANTGFIYMVKEKPDDTICVFEYVACIQSPLPDVVAVGISPYTAQGGQNAPTVTRTFTNTQQTSWKITFGIPKAPKPVLETSFVGPTEEGEASVSILNPDSMKFKFAIPRGSKIFSDMSLIEENQLHHHVEGAQKGDMCINPSSGKIFIQTATDVWTSQAGSLKGPKGDALHIVKSYEFTSDDGEDKLNIISVLVEEDFLADKTFWEDSDGDGVVDTPRMPKDDEIISVTWKQVGNDVNDISYWYYYNEVDKWQRVQLTAGFFSSIMTEYDPENSFNKLYSTGYINSLIGGNIPVEDYNKKTFSVDQLLAMFEWGDMQNADTDVFPPDPSFTRNTLSADEILELTSWGAFGKLELIDKSDSLTWGELP